MDTLLHVWFGVYAGVLGVIGFVGIRANMSDKTNL